MLKDLKLNGESIPKVEIKWETAPPLSEKEIKKVFIGYWRFIYSNRRVVHLAYNHKKERIRKKNYHRIIKEFGIRR